ncbi:hypothetical protein LNA01_15810 [Companilactobacillus nantensis]|nr:hypothetical protein LNA01_15810 [Companilactobacillus nantensis]
MALINPLFGKLYDRYGGAKPIGGGLFLMLLGMIGLLIVNQLGIFGELIIVYIIFSIGRTMAFSNILTDTLKHTATTAQADINALFSTGQQLAGSVGSTLGAVLMTIPVNLLANNFQPVLGQAVFLTLLIIILIAIIVNHLLFHPFKNTSE